MAKGSDKKRKSKKVTDKQKNAQSPRLTLGTIWDAFFSAESTLLGDDAPLKKRFYGDSEEKTYIFSFPKSSQSDPKRNCEVTRPTNETCFNTWVPGFIQDYLGDATDTPINIMKGNGRTNTKLLQGELERRALQIFSDWKNYLEKVLQMHIKIVVCLKNNSKIEVSLSKEKKSTSIDVLVRDVDKEIQTKWNDEYENSLRVFKQQLITCIIESYDFQNDNRIKNTQFNELIVDESREEIERLTILSVFCLLAGRSIDGEEYFFKKLYNSIYDERGHMKKSPDRIGTARSSSFGNEGKNSDHEITSELFYLAGKKWYDTSKEDGHKFARLVQHYDSDITPNASLDADNWHCLPINVRRDTNDKESPLLDALKETTKHMFLVGEGGIGKTTSLFSILQEAYGKLTSNSNEIVAIPIFVELSRAREPEDFYDNNTGLLCSKYILRSICEQVNNVVSYKVSEDEIERYFTEQNQTKVRLLLDGLNEVTRERIAGTSIEELLKLEIKHIMSDYQEVQVIISSRSGTEFGDECTTLYLSGIDDNSICDYLRKSWSSDKTSPRIEGVLQNEKLKDVLRIPLFLTLFAELKSDADVLSRGEILHLFFNQKKDEVYTEKRIIGKRSEELQNKTSRYFLDGTTTEMFCFMLDFILPAIAWKMVQEDAFQIKYDVVSQLIKDVIENRGVSTPCGDIGIKCFNSYFRSKYHDSRGVANAIVEHFRKKLFEMDSWGEVCQRVIECLISVIGVIQTNQISRERHISDEDLSFIHHHIRDYFASLYHINLLRMAVYSHNDPEIGNLVAKACLKEWDDRPLPVAVSTFIGEALGELHNLPQRDKDGNWVSSSMIQDDERGLVTGGLEIYRTQANTTEGYAVWNLLQILKMTRINQEGKTDLSGVDLSSLNLLRCEINGCILGESGLAAKLHNAILNDEFFMPNGHTGQIIDADISIDGKYLVTASEDETIKLWSLDISQVVCTVSQSVEILKSSSDSKYIIVSSGNFVKVFEVVIYPDCYLSHLEEKWSKEFDDKIKDVQISCEGRFLAITGEKGDLILFKKREATSEFREYECQGENQYYKRVQIDCECDGIHMVFDDVSGVRCTSFNYVGSLLAIVRDNGAVSYCNTVLMKLIMGGGFIRSLQTPSFSMDLNRIAGINNASEYKCKMYEKDGQSFKHIENENVDLKERTRFVAISPDGQYLLTQSFDYIITIWDANTLYRIGPLRGHLPYIVKTIFCKDAPFLLTITMNHEIIIWDIRTLHEIKRIASVSAKYVSAGFSLNDQYVATSSGDGAVKVWDINHLGKRESLYGHKGYISTVTYSPDGRYITTASLDGTVKLWDIENNYMAKDLPGLEKESVAGGFINAVYSPKGTYYAALSATHNLYIWKNYRPVSNAFPFKCGPLIVSGITFSKEEDIMVLALGNSCNVYALPDFNLLLSQKGKHSASINHVEYSSCGSYIITASKDKTAKIWSSDFTFLGTITTGKDALIRATICGKDKSAITLSEEGEAVLWDLSGLGSRKRFPSTFLSCSNYRVKYAGFSNSGNHIVTISNNGVLKLWEKDTSSNIGYKDIAIVHIIPGMEVQGVDLSLIKHEYLPAVVKRFLLENGAVETLDYSS